jgi:hypothetical protein
MRTPGFTAESAIGPAVGPYRRDPPIGAASGEFLGMAQLGQVPKQAVSNMPNGVELYGNWCGPGHGGSGPPIDAVDEVCCRHDQCYCEEGYFECSCDRDLVSRMPGAIADPNTPPDGQAFGSLAMTYFAVSPCVCWYEVCYPLPWPPFWDCQDIPVPGLPGLKRCPLPALGLARDVTLPFADRGVVGLDRWATVRLSPS